VAVLSFPDKLGSYAAARREIIPAIRAKASTIRPRTLTCLYDDENGRCRAFDPWKLARGAVCYRGLHAWEDVGEIVFRCRDH
jgi:hypothetical protein